ncbi:12558_t:CDS:2 [Ambispora gerdemannii]|uniref:12558_t:CDS:1 n=1 Tax=Ambispora gerdemannii TaxID=144530 RepID=A0A9N9A332_9GLOM|nr:12558_t:CDS:2 [Ambispora gerdemannii]
MASPGDKIPSSIQNAEIIGQAKSWNLKTLLSSLTSYHKTLNLPNPGTYEGLHREVKNTFLTNHLFDGGRADLTKVLSQNFQVSHTFSLGSTLTPPSYNFGAAFVGTKTFLHGTLDTDGNLSARFNYAWNPKNVSKVQTQLSPTPGHSMLQLEQDYQGPDYSLNFKTVNPSIVDNTGIFVLSYLQSITPNLALGTELVYQKPTADIEETTRSLVIKHSVDDYIATLQWQAPGALQVSYYQKINEKVDFGTELQILAAGGRREAVGSLGGKFDFRAATFRGQLDTTGRVSVVIEEKIAPGFSFIITGDIEHAKSTSRFGIGFQLEA